MTKAFTHLFLVLGLGLSACGQEIVAFEVTETKVSDCTQNSSNQVQCFDPESLSIVESTGRWLFEYTGDKFVLTTAQGQTMPGLHFADNGRVVSGTCVGAGGQCHFARTRIDSIDPESGCLTIDDRVIDIRIVDGVIEGQRSDVRFVENCDEANVREVLTDLSGTMLEEVISVREQP